MLCWLPGAAAGVGAKPEEPPIAPPKQGTISKLTARLVTQRGRRTSTLDCTSFTTRSVGDADLRLDLVRYERCRRPPTLVTSEGSDCSSNTVESTSAYSRLDGCSANSRHSRSHDQIAMQSQILKFVSCRIYNKLSKMQ